MSYFDDASLAFLPSGAAGKDGKAYSIKPTDGTGDFTFSRGSNLAATRVGADGLIEKGRENVLLYSQEFDNSYYGKSLGTLTANQTTAPNGSLTADLFTKTSAVNSVSELKKSSPIYASIGVHTYSVYVKQNVGDNVLLRLDSSGNTASALFTFSTKSINPTGSNVIDATATELSDGWFRLSVTGNVTSTSWSLSIATLYANPTNDSVFVWGAQLEQSLAATEYIETTTTTGTAGILEDTPRFDYSNGASCPSLLLEGSRTNVIGQSEYFGGSYWTKSGANVVSGFTSPEGLSNAYKLVATSNNGFILKQDYPIVANAYYTNSIYLKRVQGLGQVTMRTVNNSIVNITLTNEWQRFEASGISDSSTVFTHQIGLATAGDEIMIFGAQCEQGSYATSYIPNHSGTGTITRAADVLDGAGDVNTFNHSQGVLFLDVENVNATSAISISDDSSSNFIQIYLDNTSLNPIRYRASSGGTSQFDTSFAYSLDVSQPFKIALRYSTNNFSIWINGVKANEVLSGSTPVGLSTIEFYNIFGAGTKFDGKLKQILTFNTALSDADLATLTTI